MTIEKKWRKIIITKRCSARGLGSFFFSIFFILFEWMVWYSTLLALKSEKMENLEKLCDLQPRLVLCGSLMISAESTPFHWPVFHFI